MKAAMVILGGGDKKTIQPGEEIPEGYFSEEELESAKAAGVIEGEGPNAEEGVEGKMAPTEAKDEADHQAQARLSVPAAEAAAEEQAKADKAEAEAQKADAAKTEAPKAGPPKPAGSS
jgi:hypothetical protein